MTDLTYTALRAQVNDLHKKVTIAGEALKERAHALQQAARDTAGVADMVAAMNVDPDTVNECRELARITEGLSKTVVAFVAATDTTARTAQAAAEQAHRTHNGIQDAVTRSGVPGIHGISREWFRQN